MKKKKIEPTDPKSVIDTLLEKFNNSMIATDDTLSMVKLCTITVLPDGKEDLKGLMRCLSNDTINGVSSRFETLNMTNGGLAKLFLIEWCYRHDYLNDDWYWKWDNNKEGHVRYNPKLPIDQLIKRTKNIC